MGTVPVRVRIDRNATASTLPSSIQRDATSMIRHEHYIMDRARTVDSDKQRASQFQSLVIVQTPEERIEKRHNASMFDLDLGDEDMEGSIDYAISIECSLREPHSEGHEGFDVEFLFDHQLIDYGQATIMLSQFEHIVRQLYRHDLKLPLADMSMVPPWDLEFRNLALERSGSEHSGCPRPIRRDIIRPNQVRAS